MAVRTLGSGHCLSAEKGPPAGPCLGGGAGTSGQCGSFCLLCFHTLHCRPTVSVPLGIPPGPQPRAQEHWGCVYMCAPVRVSL